MAECEACSGLRVLEARVEAHREIVDVKLAANDRDKQFAKEDMERRLKDMNEFRAQLTQQANMFATRAELKGEAEKLDLKLAPLLSASAVRQGATRWSDHIITVLIAAAVAFLFMILKR